MHFSGAIFVPETGTRPIALSNELRPTESPRSNGHCSLKKAAPASHIGSSQLKDFDWPTHARAHQTAGRLPHACAAEADEKGGSRYEEVLAQRERSLLSFDKYRAGGLGKISEEKSRSELQTSAAQSAVDVWG
jgi:hypothetical protein